MLVISSDSGNQIQVSTGTYGVMMKITLNDPSNMANKATGDCKVSTYSVTGGLL